MNIAKFLAVFGGSAFTVGVFIMLVVMNTPPVKNDKVKEFAWALLIAGGLMIAGAVIINENGGLRLP